jgi:hypothetical protein
MERALFDAGQQKLTDQRTARTSTRIAGDHFLTGLLFDDATALILLASKEQSCC